MLLVIDNYDSFTYNLVQYLGELGADVIVRRNDAIGVDEIGALQPSAIVLSPGPCAPSQAGVTVAVIQRWGSSIPTLGVCLGHQAIVEAFGGEIGAARELVHGKATTVQHDGEGIFRGLPEGFEAGRYHSLAATQIPDELEICATAPDGEVMAVRHRTLPVHGVQFHPESVLTPVGPDLARNFLEAA
jgi:anthranilate synthase component II